MVLGSGIRDPRYGIRKRPIPDPGSRILDPGVKKHKIPDPDPQHCSHLKLFAGTGFVLTSVADPGCLSRIPDHDFYPSWIQKQQQKREG
jgi:hypothetical protein